MTLNLDLPPELEQYLLQEAEQQGLSVEAMTLQLLTHSLQPRQKKAEAVANANCAVDNLTTRWGRFVEELVEPVAVDLFQARGIDVLETYPRGKTKRQGVAMEIDILLVNAPSLVVIKCESRLSQDDVDEFLGKLAKFKDSFPRYTNYQVYGAIAGIEIDQGVDRYAYKQGLFVIKPAGDSVEITNDTTFQPRTW